MTDSLISVHMTPLNPWVAGVPHMLIGLVVMLGGVFALEPLNVLVGFLYFMMIFLNVGVPGRRARHLEIYEEGIIYQTLWKKWIWKWSDIDNVRGSYSGKRPYLNLENTHGESIRLQNISQWQQAFEEIKRWAEPAIYLKALDYLRNGKVLSLNFALRIKLDGLVHHGQYIAWSDVDHVVIDGNRVMIYSRQIETLSHRITYKSHVGLNGDIYARLIRDLWHAAKNIQQTVEPAYIMIDGISFNSEGEIIGYDHESTKFKEERI